MPTVRGREKPVYMEEPCQAFLEFLERLNIVIWPIHIFIAVIKIDVGYDERALFLEDFRNLGEFLGLKIPDVFTNSLSDNDVELFLAEFDWGVEEVRLNQVLVRAVYGDINAMIMNVALKQLPQRRRAAADIQKIALFSSGDRIYDARSLLHSKMGPRIL